MLTLNQSPGNNSDSIWVLRLRGESKNLLLNGGFDDASVWVATGGWTIAGGTAEYIEPLVPPITNDLTQTIDPISAVQYVFEYEVIACNNDAIVMNLEGGGDNIISTSLELDKTLGKHSIILQAVASKTKCRISFSSISSGDSIELDNLALRIYDNIIHIATRDINLDNHYEGSIINRDNCLTNIEFNSTIEGGGGAGSVTSYNLTISRYVDNADLTDFFNAFFPAVDGGRIVGRIIDLGIVWAGATTDDEITWLFRGRIIDYLYEQRRMTFTIFQESELTNKEIPYYSVQKNNDNGVSYFTNAPIENYGIILPIVYGDFTKYIDEHLLFKPNLFPIVCVEKYHLQYICATHKFYDEEFSTGGGTASFMYQYVDGIKTYMGMSCENGSATNNYAIAFVTNFDTLDSNDNVILGTINVQPQIPASKNAKSNCANIIDDLTSTDLTLASLERVAFKIDGSGGDVGSLSRQNGSVEIIFVVTNVVGGATLQVGASYYNKEFNSGTGGDGFGDTFTWVAGDTYFTYDLSSDFTSRDITDEPWTLADLCSLEYWVQAQPGNSVTIQNLWMRITNIIVSDVRKYRGSNGSGRIQEIRTGGGRRYR